MNTQRQSKKKSGKLTFIITLVLLVLVIAAVWGRRLYTQYKEISDIIDQAETLAQAEDYAGALEYLNDAQAERPSEERLADKYAEINGRKIAFEIESAISEAEDLAAQSNYADALAALDACMEEYPNSRSLKEKRVDLLSRKTEYEITSAIDEAESLAASSDYDGAVAALAAGLKEHPDSDELEKKQTEMQTRRIDYEIESTMSAAESLAASDDYEGAIARLDAGLHKYPDAKLLQDKLGEYKGVLLEKAKAKTLTDAKALADAGAYESALSIIKAAQQAYGSSKEYDNAYAAYSKENALIQAKSAADSGDYISAISLISGAQKLNANDVDLILAFNTYTDGYISEVLTDADAYLKDNRFDDAISVVNAALKVLPGNGTLTNKKTALENMKPISLANLDVFNGGWEWNNSTPVDPFGNDYSSACNYVIFSDYYRDIISQKGHLGEINGYRQVSAEYHTDTKFEFLTMQLAPYEKICKDGKAYVQVYADSELVYTSPTIVRKTEAFPCQVNISGADYIEIIVSIYIGGTIDGNNEGAIILANAQLWP